MASSPPSLLHALHFTGPPESDVDDLGFECPWRRRGEKSESEQRAFEEALKVYQSFWKGYLPVLIRRRKRWEVMDPRRNTAVLQRFIHKGIPSSMRREIWLRNCPPRPSPPPCPSVSQSVVDSIALDLPRTFPDNINLRTPEARNRLGRVLYSLAQHLPSIGYCQGLNFLGGVCLLVVGDEDKAADLLVHIVGPRASYYDERMSGLSLDMKVLHEFVRRDLPSVHATLDRCEVGLDILVGKWFVCLFIDSLPMESALRVWDCLIYEGDTWLFRIALRLLRGHEKKIVNSRSMDQVISAIREIGSTKNALQCHSLLKESKNEKITGKEIDDLRRRFKNTN